MNQHLYRKLKNAFFTFILFFCSILVLTPLILILKFVVTEGYSSLSIDFFTEIPKPIGEIGGGMKHAILGTLYMVLLGSLFAIPIGIGCGVYLAEFRKSKLSRFLRVCVDLLTGVPSIVIGIFAYLLIVVPLKSFSALAGGFALALIILPVVIKTSEEIFKLVPNHMREAGLALGLPRWKVIIHVVVKGSFSNLITGMILAISRSAGETAPLLFTAFGSMYVSYSPNEPMASLPVQIYTYAISPFKEWHKQAWAGAFVLVFIVLGLNLFARTVVSSMNRK